MVTIKENFFEGVSNIGRVFPVAGRVIGTNMVVKSLKKLKPNIFAKGGDRFIEEIPESKICKDLGILMVDGLGKKIQSSSDLIQKWQRKKKKIK